MPPKSHHVWVWVGAVAVAAVAVIFLSLVAASFSHNGTVAQKPCPAPCKQPPPGQPTPTPSGAPPQPTPAAGAAIGAEHTYTSSAYNFTVQWNTISGWMAPTEQVQSTDKQLGFVFDLRDWHPPDSDPWFAPAIYPFGYTGMSAGGQSAQQIVNTYQSANFPDAQKVFDMPNAMVGYEPGAGSVYDLTSRTPDGATVHERLYVMASVKGDTAVVFSAVGFFYDKVIAHPNPAQTGYFGGIWGPFPNLVTLPGDQPL